MVTRTRRAVDDIYRKMASERSAFDSPILQADGIYVGGRPIGLVRRCICLNARLSITCISSTVSPGILVLFSFGVSHSRTPLRPEPLTVETRTYPARNGLDWFGRLRRGAEGASSEGGAVILSRTRDWRHGTGCRNIGLLRQ